MDTTSEHATSPIDVTALAPSIPARGLRTALLAGTALAVLAGLMGTILWMQIAWVRLESDPPGAQVFSDGQSLGRTPLLLRTFGSATWQLRIESPAYSPWQGLAQFEPRVEGRLAASLVPLPGALVVESDPPGALVSLNGEERGETPLTLGDISPGGHRLGLWLDDYVEWSGDIRVAPGSSAVQRITLKQAPAALVLSTRGVAARVLVDGIAKGEADQEIAIEPGQRTVRVEADGKQPWQGLLDFAPNERKSVDVKLRDPWPDLAQGATISPLAIVIENEIHARPQTGLDRADIVYEALAEGGITRFLAIFASRDAQTIGPVRSARDYFVAWAQEYAAPLVHVGASPQGYSALRSAGIADLDEIRGAPGFWRSPDRQAPHNLYTGLEGARNALGARAGTSGYYSGLQFVPSAAKHNGTPATEVSLRYGRWAYTVGWSYDPVANEYQRSMDGEPHVDAETGERISATNVLVQWVDSWVIPGDNAGRLTFNQVGSGRLIALIDGVAIDGYWEKTALGAPSRYYTSDGKPLPLHPGPTWIQILPASGSVDF